MAKKFPGACLFNDGQGFNTKLLPRPYCDWSMTSTDPATFSRYNPIQTKSTLHRYTIEALLEYAKGTNSAIGVVKIADGDYASEWLQADGSSVVAQVRDGFICAGIRDPLTGNVNGIKNIGNKTTVFNCASIMLLYMLVEADKNAADGISDHTITHDLLREVADEYNSLGVISEVKVRLICDDLYYALTYGAIQTDIMSGNISPLTAKRIENREFYSSEVICGVPTILTGAQAGDKTQPQARYTIAYAKTLVADYTATLHWTEEEEELIPDLPEEMEVFPEVMLMINRYISSQDWKIPLNNPCWRGVTAYGKSTGVEQMACIMHTPLLRKTCASNTELQGFLDEYVPNTDNTPTIAEANLPTYDDLLNDPDAAYEMLTGVKEENVSGDKLMAAYRKAVVASAGNGEKKNLFKIVESGFVRALVHGYIVEVQEFSRIRDPGTLVGLNNFNKPGSIIPLVDGSYARRHKNAIVVWTDNIGLASCRKVDASVLRRFSYVIDSNEMPKDRALRRVTFNTGCKDTDLMDKMYSVWTKIAQYCKEHDINDEGTCSLAELETWVALTMLEGVESILETCRETIVNKVSSDPDTQKEIIDECVVLALSMVGLG